MGVAELFLIAAALSMDAFAVSVCKGLSTPIYKFKYSFKAGLYFGGFQMMMPLFGYLLGVQFERFITSVDHWIAFVLLGIIGFNMVKESRSADEEMNGSFSFKEMLPLAVATSIDALAVGVTFAFLGVNIIYAVTFIGVTTFLFSCAGVKIGSVFGAKYKSAAEFIGGIILMLMGLKILLEHLGIISF